MQPYSAMHIQIWAFIQKDTEVCAKQQVVNGLQVLRNAEV